MVGVVNLRAASFLQTVFGSLTRPGQCLGTPGWRLSFRVTDHEQRFLDQGFGVEVERAETDLFWTHLVNRDSPRLVAPDYGRGTTADAIRSKRPAPLRD
jgi:hypothetical protein